MVDCSVDHEGNDVVRVIRTGGSNSYGGTLIAEFTADRCEVFNGGTRAKETQ